MKYFVVADVHGFYDEMVTALDKAGYEPNNPEHILVSCGDAFDRGPDPDKVLDFFLHVAPPDRRILIRGNHEDLMEQAICRMSFTYYDETNGTKNSAYKLTGKNPATDFETDVLIDLKTNKLYNDYIRECRDFYETEHAIFVHGWIPHFLEIRGGRYIKYHHDYLAGWRNLDIDSWKKARWFNGMEAWADGVKERGKTIFCGHWHTSWGHCYLEYDGEEWPGDINHKVYANFAPFIAEGIVALDGCVPLTHVVNCHVHEEI